jgi:hypothetical protein
MTDKDAMKLALFALTYKKWFRVGMGEPNDPRLETAITSLNERLAQPEQEPVAWVNKERNTITWDKLYPDMDALYTHPPQRTEQNFCPRCGKRTADLTTIHTCTPPQD